MNQNEKIVKETLIAEGFTPQAAAAVMGVVGGETAFKNLKEASYRNTNNARIRAIFGRLSNHTDAQLNELKKSDEAFFNAVYGGIYGNSPTEGWKYVGRGFNGITFKANYISAAKCTGIDFVNQPELLEQPEFAAKALACYFKAVKAFTEFEPAFQEAYRQNAGVGKSFAFYDASKNPVHVEGIPRKRNKGLKYLEEFGV
jgi:predicted chitinase